ncbi:MAG: hypothetical protein WD577_14925 [Bacteroidales bacterium]
MEGPDGKFGKPAKRYSDYRDMLKASDIDQAFEEGITAAMATIAYKENRKVTWDHEKEQVS